jgi:hypothetical protein
MPKKESNPQDIIQQQQMEILQLRACLEESRIALRITEKDLRRKIAWREGDEDRTDKQRADSDREQVYQETGAEQAERFERGIKLAIERIRLVLEGSKDKTPYNWRIPVWQPGTGE